MLQIEFTPADLVGLRFAHSPMVEVVTSAFALHDPARYWMYGAWRARVEPRIGGLATFLAVVSGPACYVPDFLTPVPSVARPSLDDELRVLAETPLDRVAAEVDAAWAGHAAPPEIVRFGTDPAAGLAELIRQVRRYFAVALAPDWARLRAVVEGEIARRALAAAGRGPAALFAGLHPDLGWDGSAIRIGSAKDRHWGLDGHPLALLPAAFAGPTVHTMTESPTGRALWYPPRGYGGLGSAPAGGRPGSAGGVGSAGGDSGLGERRVEAPAALAALLGPTRAAVLILLAVPASTGEVATALSLAPATASHHLTTLRDAGLVVAERVGRRLRYLRTDLGEQLSAG